MQVLHQETTKAVLVLRVRLNGGVSENTPAAKCAVLVAAVGSRYLYKQGRSYPVQVCMYHSTFVCRAPPAGPSEGRRAIVKNAPQPPAEPECAYVENLLCHIWRMLMSFFNYLRCIPVVNKKFRTPPNRRTQIKLAYQTQN